MQHLIIGKDGRRKYVTDPERRAMLTRAAGLDAKTHAFCWVLAATGCRVSEALGLTLDSLDGEAQTIVVESLKKRRRGIYRSIPVPKVLIDRLREMNEPAPFPAARFWTWSRMTAYRKVTEVMRMAGIQGPHASPRGLRHGFGVSAIQSGVPLNLVQRWLGHADMRTTAIYTYAIGPEELSIAARMWAHCSLGNPGQEQPPHLARTAIF
jgi:integrase